MNSLIQSSDDNVKNFAQINLQTSAAPNETICEAETNKSKKVQSNNTHVSPTTILHENVIKSDEMKEKLCDSKNLEQSTVDGGCLNPPNKIETPLADNEKVIVEKTLNDNKDISLAEVPTSVPDLVDVDSTPSSPPAVKETTETNTNPPDSQLRGSIMESEKLIAPAAVLRSQQADARISSTSTSTSAAANSITTAAKASTATRNCQQSCKNLQTPTVSSASSDENVSGEMVQESPISSTFSINDRKNQIQFSNDTTPGLASSINSKFEAEHPCSHGEINSLQVSSNEKLNLDRDTKEEIEVKINKSRRKSEIENALLNTKYVLSSRTDSTEPCNYPITEALIDSKFNRSAVIDNELCRQESSSSCISNDANFSRVNVTYQSKCMSPKSNLVDSTSINHLAVRSTLATSTARSLGQQPACNEIMSSFLNARSNITDRTEKQSNASVTLGAAVHTYHKSKKSLIEDIARGEAEAVSSSNHLAMKPDEDVIESRNSISREQCVEHKQTLEPQQKIISYQTSNQAIVASTIRHLFQQSALEENNSRSLLPTRSEANFNSSNFSLNTSPITGSHHPNRQKSESFHHAYGKNTMSYPPQPKPQSECRHTSHFRHDVNSINILNHSSGSQDNRDVWKEQCSRSSASYNGKNSMSPARSIELPERPSSSAASSLLNNTTRIPTIVDMTLSQKYPSNSETSESKRQYDLVAEMENRHRNNHEQTNIQHLSHFQAKQLVNEQESNLMQMDYSKAPVINPHATDAISVTRNLSQLHMKPPDFSKMKEVKSVKEVQKYFMTPPITHENFEEMSKKYNYVKDLRLKNPPQTAQNNEAISEKAAYNNLYVKAPEFSTQKFQNKPKNQYLDGTKSIDTKCIKSEQDNLTIDRHPQLSDDIVMSVVPTKSIVPLSDERTLQDYYKREYSIMRTQLPVVHLQSRDTSPSSNKSLIRSAANSEHHMTKTYIQKQQVMHMPANYQGSSYQGVNYETGGQSLIQQKGNSIAASVIQSSQSKDRNNAKTQDRKIPNSSTYCQSSPHQVSVLYKSPSPSSNVHMRQYITNNALIRQNASPTNASSSIGRGDIASPVGIIRSAVPNSGAMNPPYVWPNQPQNSKVSRSPAASPHTSYRIPQSPISINSSVHSPSTFLLSSPRLSPSPTHMARPANQISPISTNYKSPYMHHSNQFETISNSKHSVQPEKTQQDRQLAEQSYGPGSTQMTLNDFSICSTSSKTIPQRQIDRPIEMPFYTAKQNQQVKNMQRYAYSTDALQKAGVSNKVQERPNYRELINNAYAIRNATSEEDLNYQIIKRTLSRDISIRRSENDLSKNIFDSPTPTKNILPASHSGSNEMINQPCIVDYHPKGNNQTINEPEKYSENAAINSNVVVAPFEKLPNLPIYNDLARNDISVTVSKVIKHAPAFGQTRAESESLSALNPDNIDNKDASEIIISKSAMLADSVAVHSFPTQSRLPESPQLTDKQVNSVLSSSSNKRESPLDLSVKTIKTKADSTGCDDTNFQFRRNLTNTLKVDFAPNFSKHVRSMAEYEAPQEIRCEPQSRGVTPSTSLRQHSRPQHSGIESNRSPLEPPPSPQEYGPNFRQTHLSYGAQNRRMSYVQRQSDRNVFSTSPENALEQHREERIALIQPNNDVASTTAFPKCNKTSAVSASKSPHIEQTPQQHTFPVDFRTQYPNFSRNQMPPSLSSGRNMSGQLDAEKLRQIYCTDPIRQVQANLIEAQTTNQTENTHKNLNQHNSQKVPSKPKQHYSHDISSLDTRKRAEEVKKIVSNEKQPSYHSDQSERKRVHEPSAYNLVNHYHPPEKQVRVDELYRAHLAHTQYPQQQSQQRQHEPYSSVVHVANNNGGRTMFTSDGQQQYLYCEQPHGCQPNQPTRSSPAVHNKETHVPYSLHRHDMLHYSHNSAVQHYPSSRDVQHYPLEKLRAAETALTPQSTHSQASSLQQLCQSQRENSQTSNAHQSKNINCPSNPRMRQSPNGVHEKNYPVSEIISTPGDHVKAKCPTQGAGRSQNSQLQIPITERLQPSYQDHVPSPYHSNVSSFSTTVGHCETSGNMRNQIKIQPTSQYKGGCSYRDYSETYPNVAAESQQSVQSSQPSQSQTWYPPVQRQANLKMETNHVEPLQRYQIPSTIQYDQAYSNNAHTLHSLPSQTTNNSSKHSQSHQTSSSNTTIRGVDQNIIDKLRTSIEMREFEKQKMLNKKQIDSETPEEEVSKPDIASLLAARIRTKGELKGFTTILSSDNGGKEKNEFAVTEKITVESPKPRPDIFSTPCTTASSGFDLLDWGNTCNDFVEQLRTGARKKTGKKRKLQTPIVEHSEETLQKVDVKEDLPGIVYDGDIDRKLVEKIKSESANLISTLLTKSESTKEHNSSSSDEDKPLNLLRQQSRTDVGLPASDKESNSATELKPKEIEDTSSKIASNQASSSNKSVLEIRTREQKRLEREKRLAARLSKISSSDSENEINRNLKRHKKLTKKPRSQASSASIYGSSDSENSNKDQSSTIRSSFRIPRFENRKRGLGSNEESEIGKLATDDAIADQDCTIKLPIAITPTSVILKREIITKAQIKCMKLTSGKTGSSDEADEHIKKKGSEASNKHQRQTKINCEAEKLKSLPHKNRHPALSIVEETMTRSKRKKELEEQLANSRVLRNDKIIRNTPLFSGKSIEKTTGRMFRIAESKCIEEKTKPPLVARSLKCEKVEDSKRKLCDDESDDRVKSKPKLRRVASSYSSSEDHSDMESKTVSERLRLRRSRNSNESTTPEKGQKSRKMQPSDRPKESNEKNIENSQKYQTPSKKDRNSCNKRKSMESIATNTEKFPPGWELEVYQYKRSLKVPQRLITIMGPAHHRVSTSLPDLDPHSSDGSDTNSVVNMKVELKCPQNFRKEIHKPYAPEGTTKTLIKTELDEQKSIEEQESIEGKSIIDILHQRVPFSRRLYKKVNRNALQEKPRILPRAGNKSELLPTPLVKASKICRGENHHIREIFGGEDRPASAPPELIDMQNEIESRMTFEKKYEEYLVAMNDIDFANKTQKNKRLDNETDSSILLGATIKKEKFDELAEHHDEETQDIELCLKDTTELPQNENINERDTPSIVSEYGDGVATPPFFKRKKNNKIRSTRRKGSSGFDYIRKKKKPTSNPGNGQEIMKKKRASPVELLSTRDENDISKEIQKWVLNKGVGQSVLHKAARLGYIDVIAYCLERIGTNPDAKDYAGYTPLHEACSKGRLDIARLLLEYGANHSEAAGSGIRPLHEASENGFIEVVRLLLSYGADPLVTTYSGQTPLALAENNEMEQFIKNHLHDVQNTGPHKQPWKFLGPWNIYDPDTCGYDVLAGALDNCEDFDDGDESLGNKSSKVEVMNLSQGSKNKCDTNSNSISYEEQNKHSIRQESDQAIFRNKVKANCAVVLNSIDAIERINTVKQFKDYQSKNIQRRRSTREGKDDKIEKIKDIDLNGEIFEFEESEIPLPPLYLLKDEGTEKWVLLNDLCSLLKVKSKDTLLKQISPSSSPPTNKELLRELKMSDFLEKATCLQLLCAGEKLNIRSSKVMLVKYNEGVRNLLGVKTVVMKI